MQNFQFPLEVTEDKFNKSYLQIAFFEYVILSDNDKRKVNAKNVNNSGKSSFDENVETAKLNKAGVAGIAVIEGNVIDVITKNSLLDLTTQRSTVLSGIVKLPLPKVISNNNTISWSDTDMSMVNVLSASAESIKQAGGEEKYGQLATQLFQAWTSSKKKDTSSSVMNYAKTAYADMTDQSYAGINKRALSFSWEFTVKSQKEAQALKALIDFVEMRILAQASRSGIGLDNFFLTYPDSCNLYFIRNGKENKNLPRYEDMVVETFNVEYGDQVADGFYTLENGEPIVVKIDMSFKEKVARLRDTSNSIKKQRSGILS